MKRFLSLKVSLIVLAFCFATVIGLSAQTLTTLYSFAGSTGGGDPIGPLVQGFDGNFYGISQLGTNFAPTVFRISPNGEFSTLYTFCSTVTCPTGTAPQVPLALATDGSFYGITYLGGAYGYGTVYRLLTTGEKTTVYSF